MTLRVLLLTSAMALSSLAAPVKSRLASFETEMIAAPVLPMGMIAVEYIENMGKTEFIQTGIYPQDGDIYRGTIGRDAPSTSWQTWLIASKTKSSAWGIRQAPYSNMNLYFSTLSANISFGPMTGEVSPFQITSGYSFYNGVASYIEFQTPDIDQFINPIMLFGLDYYNNGSSHFSSPHIRIGAFSVERESEVIINLIAVRAEIDGEWEGAMYDFVTGELFRNQGTGSFLIGPDL